MSDGKHKIAVLGGTGDLGWGLALQLAKAGYPVNIGSRKAEKGAAAAAEVLEACRGFRTFRDVEAKVGVLFADNDSVAFEPKAVRKFLEKNDDRGYRTLEMLIGELESFEPWSREAIEGRLSGLCEQHALKLADVAQPLRVAVAGRAVSPAIGTTLVFLGREKTLARIRNCLGRRGAET